MARFWMSCVLFQLAFADEAQRGFLETTATTTPRAVYFDQLVDKLPSQSNKCVAITGSTSGLGYWAAIATATKGASCLLMLNRNSSRVAKAVDDVRKVAKPNVKVISVICDLASLASVRAAAAEVAELTQPFGGLDVLALNAGVMDVPDTRTVDGLDLTMQTNHEGHFLLTKLLLPSLQMASMSRGEARIVTQSSMARAPLNDPAPKYYVKSAAGSLGGDSGGMTRYHQSKLANVLFPMALSSKFATSRAYGRIKALVAAPGASETNINVPGIFKSPLFRWLLGWLVLSAPDGSCSLLVAMFDPAAKSGDFYEPKNLLNGPPTQIIDAGRVLPPPFPRTYFGIRDSDAFNSTLQQIMWSSTEVGIGEKFDVPQMQSMMVV
eukprot:TRINITY_DN37028_c0_g1_i1.p1 TRINITY_DN37028_c0_g1~~TRINITY_DN37028_c0_g1_i1.p1  ORF type:complete len:380 (+),score=88.68 TRINITY_DN37028_c0_g1_i1:64-1203(+)